MQWLGGRVDTAQPTLLLHKECTHNFLLNYPTTILLFLIVVSSHSLLHSTIRWSTFLSYKICFLFVSSSFESVLVGESSPRIWVKSQVSCLVARYSHMTTRRHHDENARSGVLECIVQQADYARVHRWESHQRVTDITEHCPEHLHCPCNPTLYLPLHTTHTKQPFTTNFKPETDTEPNTRTTRTLPNRPELWPRL